MTEWLDLLILEDSEDDAALILRTLERGGLRVRAHWIQTRDQFSGALGDRRWDLVLSDFNLPTLNGGEALQTLRQQDGETPFILVSGEIGEERAAELMRLGANDFIRKDRLDRLVPAIERELRDAEGRRQHREAEDRLMRLGQAMDQSGDEILMTDPGGLVTYVNAVFTASTGFAPEEVLGRRPLEVLRSAMDGPPHQDLLSAALGLGQWQWQGRYHGLKKDGALAYFDCRIAALRDAQDQVAGFIWTQRDITRQAELELHIEQSQRLEAIGTLAGGIAHDFNNMLMAIRGFTEVAQFGATDPRQARSLEGILKATDRARELVQQILAFSRSQVQERRPVEVRSILSEALRFVRATLPASITIRQDLRSSASVLGDSTELQRIIVNLCTNGMQAMRGGTGALSLELDETLLEEPVPPSQTGLGQGRYLRLRVSDSGCGMPPEIVARIFEPFFTTRASTGGTGMGLSVVHGLVASMGGGISVASVPGVGTTFEILLPVHLDSPEQPSRSEGPLEHGCGQVMFVDDETMLCVLAEEMLRNLGYTPRVFTDPAEAIRAFEEDPSAVDLLMTDMTMPGMTGDLLAETLVALRPDLPVILCTGYSEKIDAGRALRCGITRLVGKPFEWREMSRTLRACLQKVPQGA